MRVDGEVELRQPREMAHHFELAHFGQQRRLLPAQVLRDVGCDLVGRVALGRPLAEGAAARTRVFEDDLFGMLVHCHGVSRLQAARTAALRVSASASAYFSMSALRARLGGADQQRVAELGVIVSTGRSRRRCRGARAPPAPARPAGRAAIPPRGSAAARTRASRPFTRVSAATSSLVRAVRFVGDARKTFRP